MLQQNRLLQPPSPLGRGNSNRLQVCGWCWRPWRLWQIANLSARRRRWMPVRDWTKANVVLKSASVMGASKTRTE